MASAAISPRQRPSARNRSTQRFLPLRGGAEGPAGVGDDNENDNVTLAGEGSSGERPALQEALFGARPTVRMATPSPTPRRPPALMLSGKGGATRVRGGAAASRPERAPAALRLHARSAHNPST